MTIERYLLGVTGSMGCGKTYVCEKLVEEAEHQGLPLSYVNLDTVRREILGTDPDYHDLRTNLAERFGYDILDTDSFTVDSSIVDSSTRENPTNSIDRRKLSDIIYYDSNAMDDFKKMVNPAIKDNLEKRISGREGVVLVEWALLVEDDLVDIVDYNVLLVTCSYDEQINRLKGGDLPIKQIYKRIAAQLSGEEKKVRIKEIQAENGVGDLYLFDTTHNPGNNEYKALLIEILA